MRKRLRKKRDQGEFKGFAFGVSYVLDDISTQRANELLDRFVEQAIGANGLECRGHERVHEWDFRVVSSNGEKPTAAQRSAVTTWLKSRKEVARFKVEELGS